MKFPVEALLRPPVEYIASASYFAGAIAIVSVPEIFMILPSVSYVVLTILLVLSAQRFFQAKKVRVYQKNLIKLTPYALSASRLPVSHTRLFLGRGFNWDQRHTQRLADLGRYDNRKYREVGPLRRWFQQAEENLEQARLATALVVFLQALPFGPTNASPSLGGNPAIHGVGLLEKERNISIDLDDRTGHMLILGTTRVGKTYQLQTIVTQDIHRGDVVIVIDPKSDPNLFRRMYREAVRAGRVDDFYFFHLGFPEVSARYSPVATFSRQTEVASRIAGQLPGEGQSQAFREFVWRYVNGISKALTALGRKSDYSLIKYYGEDIEPLFIDYLTFYLQKHDTHHPGWHQTVDTLEHSYKEKEQGYSKGRSFADRKDRSMALYRYFKDSEIQDDVAHSLIKTFEYEKSYLDKLVGSLLPLMEKLCTGKTAELLSPDYLDMDDPRPIFDWPQIIRTGGIVYVGLDALADPEVASAVGNAMFADLTSYSSRKYKHGTSRGVPGTSAYSPRVSILADEFNELIGDEFIPLLNKAGGAGFQVTVATQTWSDVIARLNSTAKAGQVAGNLNTILMLRVKELETAELLTKQLKDVEINHLMSVSTGQANTKPGQGSDFSATNEIRNTTQNVGLIHAQDITQLPKGQCFALVDGGIPVKLRLPFLDDADLASLPNNIESIASRMQERYTTSDNWYQYEPSWAAAA